MTNQNIQLLCQYNPNNNQLEIVKSQNFNSLNSDSKYIVEDAVGDIIGAMNAVIESFVDNAGGSKLFAEGHSFILEFGYDYTINLQRAREKYGEEGYRDELVAIGKASASFIVGASGSNIGKIASSIFFSSLPGKIAGAVVGGIISSELYENYAQEPVENFFNDLIDNNLLTTPNSTSIIYQQVGLNNDIKLQKEFYTIKQGDSLSSIANLYGITVEELINNNPWLESENRISNDGQYVVIKPDEKLTIPQNSALDDNSESFKELSAITNPKDLDNGSFFDDLINLLNPSDLEIIFNKINVIENVFNSTKISSNLSSAYETFLNAVNTIIPKDPLIIDLNNDGIKLNSWQNSNVLFDLDGDGIIPNLIFN